MSLRDAPRKPSGTSQPAIFAQWVWDLLAGGKFPFVDTDTIKWDCGRQGYAANWVPRGFGGSTNKPQMFPFRLYQASNILKSEDGWRTFQMRLGYIGYRSKYTFPGSGLSGSGDIVDGGNSENTITQIQGSDGQEYFESSTIPKAQVLVTLDNSKDTAIAALVGNPPTIQPAQFMLSDQPDDLGFYQAGMWVKITDDKTTGLSAQLWGRMFTGNPVDHTGRNQSAWPTNDPTIVPIGLINCGAFNTGAKVFEDIQQFQFGNLINRYAPTSGVSGNQINVRGSWIQDNLSGEVFWPGDVVVDDSAIWSIATGITAGGVGPGTYSRVFVFKGVPSIQNRSPEEGGEGLWRHYSSYIWGTNAI